QNGNSNKVKALFQGSTPPPPPPSGDAPIGKTISLKGNNGKYVSSESGTKAMMCNRASVLGWEKFTVVNAGSGKIALKGNNGKYVTSGSPMWCKTATITAAAKFSWVNAGGGKIALKGSNGKYVSSENGLKAMNCNRASVQGWEKFSYQILKSAENAITNEMNISIYPNPAQDQFTISGLTEGQEVAIYTMQGQAVYTATVTNNSLDVNTLEFGAGVYLVQVKSGSQIETRKISVK
ncbi:MAG: T9SS type A sorting domain-containing protein, partial [Bacteroidales bacterium]|nr:T9SS type A sorting domain-containing protein [Bacteroidales bacterium]